MDYLPIFADVRNRRVLVVGEGDPAQAKLRLLRRAGADVAVVSPLGFNPTDVDGCVAVFAASGDRGIDHDVAAAAHAAGLPVNVVDRPELSTFIVPAIVDRSPVIVAISSGGAAPVLARRVRAQIEALLPGRLGDLARFAGRFRQAVRRLLPEGVARRRFWEGFLASPLADRVLAGDGRAPADMLALINRAARPRKGAVYVVGAGTGDPDLLTAQALRLMQEVDIVLHDVPLSPEILDRVRRDAERVAVSCDDLIERLAREALSGRRVLRLVADPSRAEVDELRRRGVEVVVAPGLSSAEIESWHAVALRRHAG
jgi:uroporphyrin-III C-methyltransferase/precorrin-2 dehydrogenase/sirohydrochlorin ferrochelatase